MRHEELNREDLKQTALMILKTAERIARIIRSLRFVARDGSTDPFVNTSIRSIVDETLVLCESRLKNENVSLDASTVPMDLYCVCRGVQISQVLINLINNAVDAIRDLPEKWIRIEASLHAGTIHIAVTDSGPGIPKELADKIMKPFFTTKGVGKGTGLGLSISRGIAHAHGGDLELDENCSHTRFVLQLPQAHESLQTA
jgi:C4-dicarboxylate-specific signal transduction histidine kinase